MSKPEISFLSRNEIEAIHKASLQVLESTGIKVMSDKALDVLKGAGAKVDYEKNHATIPQSLVEEALRRAPKTIKYCARNPKYDFVLNKQETHFCATGGPPFIMDEETGERRYSTSEDLARCSVIADYLDHVDLIWPLGAGGDVPAPIRYIVDMYTGLRNSEKHFEGDSTSAKEAQYQIEIAAAIVGGREELRKRPIFSMVICIISPLRYDKGMTEASIELGKAGIPVVIFPMPAAGETGPATLAGTMVVNNAEFLGGLVMQEFASSGAPVVYAAGVGTVDFRTGSGISSPGGSLMHLGLNQLAHYYNLPSEIGITGGTVSKLLDTQAGYEKARTIITHLLTTPDIALGLGGLERARIISPEALVIDNEIIDYALRFAQGFEVNDETLAVDVIHKVGPGGIFLGEKHTLKHFRERWMSRLSDIDSFETWEKKGSKSIDKMAHEKVKEILATHKPEPIPEDVEKEISGILQRAEAELVHKG
ncbi:MAG: trimethylamine methyltransferase family protein [Dehalococcoidia bacterium]|nr:trimethylamine methyltransferase family protein [Dehalococcoidia bacterium]